MNPYVAIFAEVDSRLTAVSAAANGSYERMPSGDPDRFPALAAFDGGDELLEHEAGSTRLALTVTVQGFVEGYDGPPAHDAMIALHAVAVVALCGEPMFDLNDLVESVEIDGRRRVQIAELADKRRLGFEQDFTIIFSTRRGDPSQAA